MAVIEVSDSTLSYDLNEKLELYASASIALYFVVDLKKKLILKYSEPANNRYANIEKVTQ